MSYNIVVCHVIKRFKSLTPYIEEELVRRCVMYDAEPVPWPNSIVIAPPPLLQLSPPYLQPNMLSPDNVINFISKSYQMTVHISFINILQLLIASMLQHEILLTASVVRPTASKAAAIRGNKGLFSGKVEMSFSRFT